MMPLDASPFRALALDMDGTVLDSERVVLRIWDETARGMGFEYDWDVMVSTVGATGELTREILEKAHPGLPHADIRKETSRRYRLALDAREVPTKPGLMQLLRAARAKSLAIGLCTSTRRATAEAAVAGAGLAGWFDAMVCAHDAAAGKPDPAPYLMMAERLGRTPSECVAVEDSPTGALSAIGAGFTVILVPDLIQPPPDVAARAAAVLPSLADVAAMIEAGRAVSEQEQREAPRHT